MKKILLLMLAACFSVASFSQDDENLDDIFDDGDKNSKLHILTDFVTWGTLTPNIGVEFRPIDLISLTLVQGVSPFGAYFEPPNLIVDIAGAPMLDTGMSVGYHTTGLLKFHSGNLFGREFSWYGYGGIRLIGYSLYDRFKVRRYKVMGGIGYKLGLFGRFNADLRLGLHPGAEIITYKNGVTPPAFGCDDIRDDCFNSSTDRFFRPIVFFDVGLMLTYAL